MRKKPSSGRHAEAGAVDAEDAGRAQQPQHVVLVGPARRQRAPSASRRSRRSARRTSMPGIAFRLFDRQRGARPSARRGRSAGAIDRRAAPPRRRTASGRCCTAVRPPVFLIAASASSRRGERPTPIQPVRQPGARYAFDRLENVMIGASGSRLPIGCDRAVVTEVAVDLVGQNRRDRGARRNRAARAAWTSDTSRRSGCSDRSRRARASSERDQALQVIEVGLPAAVRIGPIVARARVDLREHRGVERIRRHRHEHLAAAVDERAQDEIDGFRRTCRNAARDPPRSENHARVNSAATASRAAAMPGDGP